MNDVAKHYDILVDEGQDPVYDPKPLKDYMDKWDGQAFVDKMKLDGEKSVLEIGVGTGRIAVRVAPKCGKFTGIDVSRKSLVKAVENIKNANLLLGDFCDFEFREKFDVIYSTLTFMHIENKAFAIQKIASLLANDGLFVLSIDKNQSKTISAGFSTVKVFPDSPEQIEEYAEKAGLNMIEKSETEFAHIFVFNNKI